MINEVIIDPQNGLATFKAKLNAFFCQRGEAQAQIHAWRRTVSKVLSRSISLLGRSSLSS